MRIVVCLLLLISLVEVHAHHEDDDDDEDIPDVDIRDTKIRKRFSSFKKENPEVVMAASNDNASVKKRFNIFAKNEKDVETHNRKNLAEPKGYRKELNRFSVMTSKERKLSTGLANVTSTVHKRSLGLRARLQLRETPLRAYDHRVEGHVSPVTNQASCGSCWAHAASYSLEGGLAIASGEDAKQLSLQELLSCAYEDEEYRNGCNGGWYMDAWEYVKKSGHLAELAEEPYVGMDLHCDPDIARKPNMFADYRVTDWERVPEGDDYSLAIFAAKHVISVGIYAGKHLYAYADGIFTDGECTVPAKANHAVTLVGFTPEAWIIKNSWGKDWGEKGYVKMSRDVINNCGIADYAYFPLIEKKEEKKKQEEKKEEEEEEEKVVPKCATCCESVWGDKMRDECPVCE